MPRLSIRKKRTTKDRYRVACMSAGGPRITYLSNTRNAVSLFAYFKKQFGNATLSELNPATNKYRKRKKYGWK
jgi:hypothetical protein